MGGNVYNYRCCSMSVNYRCLKVAERNGLWDHSKGLLDFSMTYSPKRIHPAYSYRRYCISMNLYYFIYSYITIIRRWRVLDTFAPSLKLSPTTDDNYGYYLPFSVKAEKKITVEDLFALNVRVIGLLLARLFSQIVCHREITMRVPRTICRKV
jgi:dipeptidase